MKMLWRFSLVCKLNVYQTLPEQTCGACKPWHDERQGVPYMLERLSERIRLSSPLRYHSQAQRSCAFGLQVRVLVLGELSCLQLQLFGTWFVPQNEFRT
jgi:hypothetical protein